MAKRKTGGRNNVGRMTARGIGGGHKQRYRIIDFKREKMGVEATVEAIEYDPNRSARIALLKYKDGEKRYILAPIGLAVGAKVMSGPDAELSVGNALPLKKIIPGMPIHNIELHRGHGGQICRSAGGAAQITASEGDFVTVKLPSSEIRLINRECYATIGQIGNTDHINIMLGKAAGTVGWDGAAFPAVWPATRLIIRWGWPGQEQGRWRMASPVFAVGPAGQGRQDAPAEEVFELDDLGEKEEINGTFPKKRPVCRRSSDGEGRDHADEREEADQDVVTSVDDCSGVCGTHIFGS